MYIYSHNRYSEGANLIRKALRIKSLARAIERMNRLGRRRLREEPIINWGSASINIALFPGDVKILNLPSRVSVAHCKLQTLQVLSAAGVSVPEFTTDRSVAQQWVNDGYTVVVRTLLNASEGKGIILWSTELPLADNVRAPLYVKYVKKKHEYRIHVANFRSVGAADDTGYQVICIQHKRRVRGFEDRDNQIRNHDNGWVFAVQDIVTPASELLAESRKALKALGLDFGAVDVIWNEKQQKAYVLEVNTAPGLEPEGTALRAYCDYFRRFI